MGAPLGLGLFDGGPRRFYYGDTGSQFVNLYERTPTSPWPVIVTIHGGAWQDKEDLSILEPIREISAGRGLRSGIEYRRGGEPGGGWPGTFEDVAPRWTCWPTHPTMSVDGDRSVLGHSAGAHRRCGRPRERTSGATCPAPIPRWCPGTRSGYAGIPDVVACVDEDLVDGACAEVMGASPEEEPDRYSIGSPESGCRSVSPRP